MRKTVATLLLVVLGVCGVCRGEFHAVKCPQNAGDGNFSGGQQWQRVMKGMQSQGNEQLAIGNNSYLTGPNRSLLRFDLSSIAATETVQRASLRLDNYEQWDAGPMDLRVHRITEGWTTLVGWSDQPTFEATTAAQRDWYEGGFGDYYDVQVDVTDLVAGWISGSWDNNGMLLRSFDDDSPSESPGAWYVRDAGEGTRPLLEVITTHPALDEQYQAIDVLADATVDDSDPCDAIGGYLYVGDDGGATQQAYLLFEGIAVAQGKYVKAAYLHLKGNYDNPSSAPAAVSIYACTGDDDWTEGGGGDKAMTWYRKDTLAPAGLTSAGEFQWANGDLWDHWSASIELTGDELAEAVLDNGRLTLLLRWDGAPAERYKIWDWNTTTADRDENLNPFGHYGAWLEVITALPPYCGDPDNPTDPGDVSGDCIVDMVDVTMMAAHWLEDRRP